MKNNEHYRILIINGQSIYKNNATGITLESIFSNWPVDKLFEIFIHENNESRTTEFTIKSKVAPAKIFPVNNFIRKIVGKGTNKVNQSTNSQKKRNTGIRNAIKDHVKFCSEYFIYLDCASSINDDIEKFNPHIIYTLGNSIQAMRLAYKISRKYDLPIILHYMDNWRETAYYENRYTKHLNIFLNRIVNQLESRMVVGLTISDKMSTNYEEKYGFKYKTLMNSINYITEKTPSLLTNVNQYKCVYAGGLHLERFKSILKVEEALLELSRRGLNIKLEVYTKDTDKSQYEHLFNNKVTTFKEFLTRDKILNIYGDAHILVHIESFDLSIIEYTKYSISTKIPEYMASGKPIICYSPKHIAVSQYINDNKVGIATDSYEVLISGIEKMVTDKDFYYQCAINGLKTARKNHTKTAAFATLVNTIDRGVKGKSISIYNDKFNQN